MCNCICDKGASAVEKYSGSVEHMNTMIPSSRRALIV